MADACDLIEAMKASGISDEQALLVLTNLDKARRSRARECNVARQRALRERNAVTRDIVTEAINTTGYARNAVTPVTRDIVTPALAYKDNRAHDALIPVGTFQVPPILEDSPLPTEGPQIEKQTSEEPKRKYGTCLPENWVPSEELFAYGGQHGLTREQTETIFEDMRIWAGANRNRAVARKADWNLTAKGFIRRDAIKFKARAGPTSFRRDPYAASLLDTIRSIENDRISALNPVAGNGFVELEKFRQDQVGSMPSVIEIDVGDDAASG